MTNEKIKGMSYGYMAKRNDYRSYKGIESQELMYSELQINWICLPIVNNQTDINSTTICQAYNNPSDRDILSVINLAHEKNVKVCLKPMVNSDDYMWRAYIGKSWDQSNNSDPTWDKWFKSYTNFILYYAEIAQETNCEMLCIGCEMLGTEHRQNDWITLIRRIRCIYNGKLVYNTNHHAEEGPMWFDELDYIATSAYYSVGVNGTSYNDMKLEWEKIRTRLNDLSERKQKQYIFMEIGCRSAKGCSLMPWDFEQSLPFDEDEQLNFYKSCMDVFWNDDHFAGVFWWDWSTFIYNDLDSALNDTGFNIHLKKTADYLRCIN